MAVLSRLIREGRNCSARSSELSSRPTRHMHQSNRLSRPLIRFLCASNTTKRLTMTSNASAATAVQTGWPDRARRRVRRGASSGFSGGALGGSPYGTSYGTSWEGSWRASWGCATAAVTKVGASGTTEQGKDSRPVTGRGAWSSKHHPSSNEAAPCIHSVGSV